MNFKKQSGLVARFLLGGSIGGGIHNGIFFGLNSIGVWYIASHTIGYFLGTSVNFFIQKHITFKNKEKLKAKKQFWIYIAIKFVIWALQGGILYLCVDIWKLSEVAGQLISIPIITVISFFISKRYFKNPVK